MPESEVDILVPPTTAPTASKPPLKHTRRPIRKVAAVRGRSGRPKLPVPTSLAPDYDPEDDSYPNDVFVQVDENSRSWDMYTPTGERQPGVTTKPKANRLWIEMRRPRKTSHRGIIDDEVVYKAHKFPFRAIDSPLIREHKFPLKELVKEIYRMKDNGKPLILTAVSDAQLAQEKTEKRRIRVPGTVIDESIGYTANVRYPSPLPAPTIGVGYSR